MYNILIVDDSKTIRAMINKTIEIAGVPAANIWEAANGQEGLDILHEQWVDIVFADINMPVMTGIEMVEKMSEEGLLETVPVVIVSTEGSRQRIEDLRAMGVRAYLRKPFAPEALKEVIADILETENA